MHEMLTVVTDVCRVCHVLNRRRHMQCMPCAWGHLVQPSPNAFGLLFLIGFFTHFFLITFFTTLFTESAVCCFSRKTLENAWLWMCWTNIYCYALTDLYCYYLSVACLLLWCFAVHSASLYALLLLVVVISVWYWLEILRLVDTLR